MTALAWFLGVGGVIAVLALFGSLWAEIWRTRV